MKGRLIRAHTTRSETISCKGQLPTQVGVVVGPSWYLRDPLVSTTQRDASLEQGSGLKVPCSYKVSAIGKLALLRYLSEFRFQVLTAITNDVSSIYP